MTTTHDKAHDHGHQGNHKDAKGNHGHHEAAKSSASSSKEVKKTAADNSKSAKSTDHHGPAHGKQGFASMPKKQVQEIASKGGKAGHHDKHHK